MTSSFEIVLNFALEIQNSPAELLYISEIVSYELLLYYKINGCFWKASSVWRIFHSNFKENRKDSIQISEAPKMDLVFISVLWILVTRDIA